MKIYKTKLYRVDYKGTHDDEVDQGGYYNWYGQWIPHSTKKERYSFYL